MSTPLEELEAYRTGSADKLRVYAEDAKAMAYRLGKAMAEFVGAIKDDERFRYSVDNMEGGIVELRTVFSFGNRKDANGLEVRTTGGVTVSDSFAHVWQVFLERGGWCLRSAYWSNTRELNDEHFTETVRVAVKSFSEAVTQELEKAYHNSRWDRLYGKANEKL